MKRYKKSNNLIKILVALVIIAIIIFFLLKKCSSDLTGGKVTDDDIYDIKCEKVSCTDISEGFEIGDGEETWGSENELKIFSQFVRNGNETGTEKDSSGHEVEPKIAPEDSGSYEFVINNNLNKTLIYSVVFTEENPYNINLKYRLRNKDEYIEDEWVNIYDLKINDVLLKKGGNTKYYLEWKWISTEEDTKVANLEHAYKVKIEIKAETAK